MTEPGAELFVVPPVEGGGGLRERHDVLQEFPGSVLPGFFTLPDGCQLFRNQVTGDPLSSSSRLR